MCCRIVWTFLHVVLFDSLLQAQFPVSHSHSSLHIRFEKLHGQPGWAATADERRRRRRRKKRKRKQRGTVDLQSESEEDMSASDSEEEGGGDILKRTGNLLASSLERLPKGTIDLKRMKDANSAKRAQAVVRSVEFHPTASVLLTAGYHKTVDLFQVGK